jgi:hypothetical protein|tara:strand:+ start:697 stop:1131 length:435 start_codon:yes stop_codon:yes gene_type:complete
MTLDELKNLVQEDLVIDKTELDVEALKTPQLHNKYLNFLLEEKLMLTKSESDLRILRKIKWLYYTGKMSVEELEDRGLEPFPLNVLKQDIDKFIDSDDEIVKLTNRVEFQKEKVEYLKTVVKTMSDRQWYIRSAIDWIKFTNGN